MTLKDKRILSVTELLKAYELMKQKPIVHTIPLSRRPSLKSGQSQASGEGKLASLLRGHAESDNRENKPNEIVTYRTREKRSDIVSHLG